MKELIHNQLVSDEFSIWDTHLVENQRDFESEAVGAKGGRREGEGEGRGRGGNGERR